MKSELTPVNIVMGRFQPFTDGHLKCCQTAFDQTGNKTVLCVIRTDKADPRHPFLSNDMTSIFNDLVKSNETGKYIDDYIFVKSADIVAITAALHEKEYEPVTWTCGTDRVREYTRIANNEKYTKMAGLEKPIEIIEVKRGDEDISATKARRCLRDDDYKGFAEITPTPVSKQFDKLRELLLQVKENKTKSLLDYVLESLK